MPELVAQSNVGGQFQLSHALMAAATPVDYRNGWQCQKRRQQKQDSSGAGKWLQLVYALMVIAT